MNTPAPAPSLPTPLARRWTLIFALFVVHNLEELVLDLPAWGRTHLAFLNNMYVSLGLFGGFVAFLCIVLFALAYGFRKSSATTRKLMVLFLAVMLGVFGWHVGISLHTGSLQPGVVTAVVFFPAYALWLVRLVKTDGSARRYASASIQAK